MEKNDLGTETGFRDFHCIFTQFSPLPTKNKVMNHGIKRREGGIKDQEQGDRATHKNKRKWGTKENKKREGRKKIKNKHNSILLPGTG